MPYIASRLENDALSTRLPRGDSFEWQENPKSPGDWWAHPKDGHHYKVDLWPWFFPVVRFLYAATWYEHSSHWLDNGRTRLYLRLADAKTACERHHTTGKWE